MLRRGQDADDDVDGSCYLSVEMKTLYWVAKRSLQELNGNSIFNKPPPVTNICNLNFVWVVGLFNMKPTKEKNMLSCWSLGNYHKL